MFPAWRRALEPAPVAPRGQTPSSRTHPVPGPVPKE